jgi:two-component sensor histidine kinase
VHTSEEIGQVARAFDIVLDQAARLAAGQARLRGLLKATITNLSRRSQALVERQISVIDQLEQDEGDPEQLAVLFALDHLATRMRRNNENLLVLSDTPLRQRTSTPAPIAEVVGAAISEIDKYKRVRVNELPDVAVYPHAVSNLIHLIAELLDNATEFSAPDTEVTVDGRLDRTSGHLSLLIRDRGLGLDAERLEKFNTNLATPPELDASVSQQMGLFVVAKLAARNGIHVELRVDQELDAGTSALVVIPGALLQVSAAARTSVDQAPHVTSDSATDGGSASRVDLFDPETIDPTPPDDTHTYRTWTPSSAEGAREAEHSGTAAATDIGAQTERFAPIRVAVSQWFQSTTEEESGQGGGGTVPEQQPTQSRQGAPVAATGPHPQHHTAVLPRQASDATRPPRWEPIDAGWRAAHEVSTRRATAAASTTTGLPKRQPHNDLLPGAMTAPPSDDRGGAQRPTRSAAARREGLTGLQQGISLARQYPQSATTGSQPQWHPPPRPAASQEQA